MGKTLVIAEKPSVARDIARVLKCTGKGEGCLHSDEYVVSWAIGHLVTLCEPDEYKSEWKKWDMNSLPIVPDEMKLKAVTKTKVQLGILKKLMNEKDTDKIICATDSGREGELIFRYIYDIVKCKKPFGRLWISSMTDEAITEGFKRLKDGKEYDNLYYSAKCRSEADWLVGINATRAFTVKYDALLSIGRVQTPTLAIIVKRTKEIEAFVPKEYFEVDAQFGSYSGKWINLDLKENETKIDKKEDAEQIAAKILNKQAVINDIKKEPKKIPPPLLYDLTELQRDANRRYGFSADKTLKLAQELYEKHKMITYPRTDSRYLTEDMRGGLSKTVQKLNLEPYAEIVGRLSSEKLSITSRIINNAGVNDHHAIIPTGSVSKFSSLPSDEAKIFDLITRRFLSAFMPAYQYTITKIITLCENETFISKGKMVTQLGWKELYQGDKDADDDEVTLLPELQVGYESVVINADVLTKHTKPPSPYTEATLLSAMENPGRFVEDEALREQMKKSGLGTPATRAAIIERLITVNYLFRKGKALIPTDKGVKLIDTVPDELKSPETTGKWEKGLASIAEGNMDKDKFMQSIIKYVNFIVEDSRNTTKKIEFEPEKRGKAGVKKAGKTSKTGAKASRIARCPICLNADIFFNTKAYYCANWRNGCKFTIWRDALDKHGAKLTDDMVANLIDKKEIEAVTFGGNKITIRFKLDVAGMIQVNNIQ